MCVRVCVFRCVCVCACVCVCVYFAVCVSPYIYGYSTHSSPYIYTHVLSKSFRGIVLVAAEVKMEVMEVYESKCIYDILTAKKHCHRAHV